MFNKIGNFFGSIGSAVWGGAQSAFNKVAPLFAGNYKSGTAAAGDSIIPTVISSSPAPTLTSTSTPSGGIPAAGAPGVFYTPTTPSGFTSNIPANLAPQYGPQLPRTISSGKGSGDFMTAQNLQSTPTLLSSAPTSTRTLSSGSFSTLGGTGTTTSAPSSYSAPLNLPSAPASANPKIDTSALAGRTAGLYQRNADGTFTEVKEEQDLKMSTSQDKVKEKTDLYEKYLGIKPSVYQDAEVIRAQQEKRRIQEALRGPVSELNAVLTQQKQQLLSVRQVGAREGVTEAVYGNQERAINYDAAIRALPLQASISALQGDLQLASDYLTELTQIKQEQINNQYEYNKALFNSISTVLDKEDQRAYDELKTTNERRYKEEQDLIKTQAELTQQALANGASTSVISRINSASSIQEAVAVAGKYGVPSTVKTTIPQAPVGLTPEQAADPFIQKMANSAGGKPLAVTDTQAFEKGLGVLGQLGLLQENIKGTKTGPIMGTFRGANPWDTNAQTIKAQLNAIVPNLARGVYGEVGVLTDNDIKTYSKTLPNLTSTEAVRTAVLGITVDLVGKSLKRKLQVNEANGKDVSGFIDLYTEMQNTRDSIFQTIPGYKGANADPLGLNKTPVDKNNNPLGI